MRKLLLVILIILPAIVRGQDFLSGKVIDSQTHEPLSYATVYLNGTTKGTITDSLGCFEIRNVKFPTTVVISFVGYKTQVHELSRHPGGMMIELKQADNLPEVIVTAKGEREQIMAYFKSMFLGDDRWGRHAVIRNPDALMFDLSPDQRTLKAWANEPLIIDLPLLGYELYVNLIDFNVERYDGSAACDILGYFFFRPYGSDRLTQRHQKNRLAVYYDSNQHFLRSLYQNRLAENGYVLMAADAASFQFEDVIKYEVIDASLYTDSIPGDMMRIHGLSDKRLKILFYHKLDGSPLDLTRNKKLLHPFSKSGMHLLLDTCTFHKDGIVTDNSIRFTGDISQKRIGASLPDDFTVN